MNRTLQNKRAFVTGGSRGTGAASVKRLAREGAHVALTYVSKPDEANQTAVAAKDSPLRIPFALLLGLSIGLAGCARAPSEAPPAAIPVTVSRPVERGVTDYADFTGRTVAVDS